MISVVKTVVLSAGNAEEIAISSKHISSLMHGHIYMPSAPRELNWAKGRRPASRRL